MGIPRIFPMRKTDPRFMGGLTVSLAQDTNGSGEGQLVYEKAGPPLFFASVASKGLSPAVSLLFATLAGRSISVAAKGLMGADCWQESNRAGPEDSEGVRRTAWRASMVRGAQKNRADLTKPL